MVQQELCKCFLTKKNTLVMHIKNVKGRRLPITIYIIRKWDVHARLKENVPQNFSCIQIYITMHYISLY